MKYVYKYFIFLKHCRYIGMSENTFRFLNIEKMLPTVLLLTFWSGEIDFKKILEI
jgi:hypothetical protein